MIKTGEQLREARKTYRLDPRHIVKDFGKSSAWYYAKETADELDLLHSLAFTKYFEIFKEAERKRLGL